MTITLSALQKQRRDTAANWTAENPTLLAGELGLESDTGYWKVGDGSTAWTSLAYVSGLGGEIPVSRLADGAAGQIIQTDAAGTDVEWSSTTNLPLGTAAAPAYRFQGDPNTGIYSPGADQLAISTGGSGRLFVDASGRVGVGTTSPGSYSGSADNLVIAGSTNTGVTIVSETANYCSIYFADGVAPGEAYRGAIEYNHANNAMGLYTNSLERLRIDSLGRVGIGTIFPDSPLHVAGTSGTGLRIGYTNNTNYFDANTQIFRSNNSTTTYGQWDSSGRLLVGTSTARANFYNATISALFQQEGATSSGDPASRFMSLTYGKGNIDSGVFVFAKHRATTVGGQTVVVDGDRLGELNFQGSDGTEFVQAASIRAEVDGTPGANDMPGRLVFSTTADGASSPTERMRINSVGQTMVNSAGSAAAPVISKVDDTNTGIFFPAADTIAFAEGGTEVARLDSSGRLLVGTSSSLDSGSLIQAYKASGGLVNLVKSASLGNDQFAAFQVAGGSRIGQLSVLKHSGITNPCAYVYLQEEDGTGVYVWSDNSSNLRISSTGGHVGTTSGTVVGAQTSDERLKNVLGPVEYGLDTLKQIEPVRYALKSEPDTEKLGFIAQQVLPIVPQSVFDTGEKIEEGEPTKLGMEYVALIPVLVNAIKELSAEVDALKAQLS
jgi:hypothetical protein